MSSLHKRARSPYWWGKFRDDAGTIRFRSTKKSKRDEAQEILLAWQRSANAARSGELTKAAVLKTLNEMLERTTGERLNVVSIREFLENWLKGKAATGKSRGTVARYKPVATGFLKHIGEQRANASIAGVTATLVESYRTAEQESGKAAASVNLGIRILRTVFNDAKRKGLIPVNPADAVELIDEPANERQPFADHEITKLLEAADDEWRGMILLGAHLGLRIGDAAKVTWEDVDLDAESLRITPQKTARHRRGKPQYVALHPELAAYFDAARRRASSQTGPVFKDLVSKTTGGHQGLSNAFSTLLKNAEIVGTTTAKRGGKGRSFRALTFHSLRHSFVSRLANKDVGPDVRKEIAGHSSDDVHRRYTHLDLSAQRRALALLESFEQ